jgi:hypothetical protein
MRTKFAFALWVGALLLLITAKDTGSVFEWHSFISFAWLATRIAILFYSGLLLFNADDDIKRLSGTVSRYEGIIGELERDRQAGK